MRTIAQNFVDGTKLSAISKFTTTKIKATHHMPSKLQDDIITIMDTHVVGCSQPEKTRSSTQALVLQS